MNLKKLRKHLPGLTVTRTGRKIEVSGAGLSYKIDNERGRSESAAAEYLRSRIPVQTTGHQ